MYRRVLYYVVKHLRPFFVRKSAQDRNIELLLGQAEDGYEYRVLIECKSAEHPENLVGFGLDAIVIEEAALIPRQTISSVIRPALADRKGDMLAISTPKRTDDWFRDWHSEAGEHTDWESWTFTTKDGGNVDDDEIASMAKDMSDDEFRQEILAEDLQAEGAVFKGVDGCAEGSLKPYREGKPYLMAADLAKYEDWTVIGVADVFSRQLVYFDRFRKIDWNIQRQKIRAVSKLYGGCPVILDSSGVGDPIAEELIHSGQALYPFKITAMNKSNLIQGLVVAIEQEQIRFPKIESLVKELKGYQYEKTPSGLLTTNARSGQHDDCVIMLALLWWGLMRIPVRHRPRVMTVIS